MSRTEPNRRKDEAIALAMAWAAMRGIPMRVTCTSEAEAKRLYRESLASIKRNAPTPN